MGFGVNTRADRLPRLLLIGVLFVGVGGTAGCAGAREQVENGDLVFAIREGAACRAESHPAELPQVAELVDATALSSALRELKSSFDLPAGHAVLTMFYQADGLNIRRDLIEHSLPPPVADSVQKLVFANRASVPESEQDWGVRLVIDLAGEISYRVDRREYCPPWPRNPQLQSQMGSFFSTGPRYRAGVRERDVVLRVGVLPSGIVAGARVIRGADSGSEFEQRLMIHVRQYAFQPATLDGYPVYGELDIPIRVRDP